MRDVVIPVMPGKAVTLSWDAEIVAGDGYGYVYIFPNGQTENMAMGTVATQSLTYTAADDVTYMAFRVGVGVAGGVIAFKNVMLNYGTTAEAYEPFLGNDAFTAAFDQTIYGGTLNWTTGEMAVEWELKTLDGTDNVIKNDNEPFKIGLPENSDYQLACCSHYTVATSLNADLSVYYASNYYGNNKLCIYDSRFADTDSFKAFLAAQYAAGTPVQIVYKLATPTTIQLTAREIRQLAGTNTLYGDGTSLRAIFNASASSPVDTNLSTTSSNPVQNKTVTSSINSLKSVATASSAGLMSATDKSKLDTITTSADSVSFSQSATSGNKVGTITINGTAIDMYSPIQTTISGNAATATKVSNVLTIQANGSSLGTFDGSSAKTFNITYSNVGAAASSHGTHVSYGTSASALGTSSAGSASTVSRSDHVHALPALTSCTGTLTIAKGGTGATSAANARSNLGIKSGTTLPTSGSVGDIFFLY